MEFKKVTEGRKTKEIILLVNNEQVGKIYKDDQANHNFNHIIQLDFEIKGYRNRTAKKNWKEAQKGAERLYKSLMNISKQYDKEIQAI